MRIAKYVMGSDATPRIGLIEGDRLRPLGAGAAILSETLHAGDVAARVESMRGQGGDADRPGRRPPPGADRRAGGLGGGRYLREEQGGSPGGVGTGGLVLRPGLPRGAARAVLQGDAEPGRRAGPADPGPPRHEVVRPRTRAGAGPFARLAAGRVHRRQRRQRARHRGGEPALSAAGEGLRRLLRAGPGDHPGGGDAAGPRAGDPPGDRARRRDRVRREHLGRPDGADARRPDRLARARQPVPAGGDPADRHRDRPPRRVQPPAPATSSGSPSTGSARWPTRSSRDSPPG